MPKGGRECLVFLLRIEQDLRGEKLREKALAAGIPPDVIEEVMRGCEPA